MMLKCLMVVALSACIVTAREESGKMFVDRDKLISSMEKAETIALYTLAIGGLTGALIVLIIACMMFGARTGSKKRLRRTQAHELVRYLTVRNAFINLRTRFNITDIRNVRQFV